MKIISKFVDYYDQMRWVYGEDPLLILDRRATEALAYYSADYGVIEDRIEDPMTAGSINPIEVIYLGTTYYGYRTRIGVIYHVKKLREYLLSLYPKDVVKSLDIKLFPDDYLYGYYHSRKIKTPELFMELYRREGNPLYDPINDKTGQPILVADGIKSGVYAIPNCTQIDFPTVIDADTAWKEITAFLAKRKTAELEADGDILNDKQKTQSHGFDVKRSFRPKIKS